MFDSQGKPYNVSSEQRESNFEEIQKWLIQMVSFTNDKIKNELLGNSWVENKETAGWFRDPNKARLISREGASKIFSIVEEYTNPSILLGNIGRDQQQEIINDFGFDIIDMIGDNYEQWGISPDDRRALCNSINNYIWMILTRPTGGLDRGWFDKIVYNITKLQKSEDSNKSGLIPFPLGPRKE